MLEHRWLDKNAEERSSERIFGRKVRKVGELGSSEWLGMARNTDLWNLPSQCRIRKAPKGKPPKDLRLDET